MIRISLCDPIEYTLLLASTRDLRGGVAVLRYYVYERGFLLHITPLGPFKILRSLMIHV